MDSFASGTRQEKLSRDCRTALLLPPRAGISSIRGGTMQRDPESHVMEKAYARWAPVYDALCGPFFLNGRRAAALAAREVGGRILEIGVGTGLSFDDYDETTEITGIDMSEPMIARARMRAASGRYPHVKGLTVMDAHDMRLPGRELRLRGRPVRHHPGRGSRARAVGMRARGEAGRADHPGQPSLFREGAGRRGRAAAGAEGARGSACGRNSRSSGWPPGRKATAAPS